MPFNSKSSLMNYRVMLVILAKITKVKEKVQHSSIFLIESLGQFWGRRLTILHHFVLDSKVTQTKSLVFSYPQHTPVP